MAQATEDVVGLRLADRTVAEYAWRPDLPTALAPGPTCTRSAPSAAPR